MRKVIENYEREKEKLRKRIEMIDNFIKSFQSVCSHTKEDGTDAMEYEGNDSHKTWYKCEICGYNDWR